MLFFIFVIILLPIVDNLTGALFKLKLMPEGFIGSPSQLARFALFIFVICLVDKLKSRTPLKVILLLTCYFLTVEVVIAFVHINFKAFLYGIVFSIKLLFTVSCYFFVAGWINQDKEKTVYTIKQIINYGTIIAFLVLTAYFSGFHIPNYGIGMATRGLFISGNGLGIVLGISTILLVHYTKDINLRSFAHILFLIATTALLGTKASLIFLFFSLLLLFIKLLRQSPVIGAFLVSITGIYLLIPLMELIGGIFENIIFKFNNIENKLTFIASSRDRFIKDAFQVMNIDDFYSLRVLFGGGAYYAYSEHISNTIVARKSLENDLFELFFCYGLFIAVAYIISYFYALKRVLHNGNKIIALVLSLAFFHSITMGHVLFNGTSAITYALCLALSLNGAKVSKNDF